MQPLQVGSILFHFQTMMGPYGLYQHATIREPLLSEGYCTDDNARAVQMLVRLMPLVALDERSIVQGLLARCWQFLQEAHISPGHFYNFRSAAGEWLPQGNTESEDMIARVIRACVEILHSEYCVHMYADTLGMLQGILQRADEMRAPRFWAEYLIATKYADTEILPKAASTLKELWEHTASVNWPWFEGSMTYANALFPHGMLVALQQQDDETGEEILHASAGFLIRTTIQGGIFVPIGSNGWYPKGAVPSKDNQQAIEAGTMLDFLIDYQAAYPDKVNREDIAAVYLWFFGKNTHSILMADEKTGACLDGIFQSGPNPNNGAESMLAYQWAEIRIREASEDIQQFVAQQKAAIS